MSVDLKRQANGRCDPRAPDCGAIKQPRHTVTSFEYMSTLQMNPLQSESRAPRRGAGLTSSRPTWRNRQGSRLTSSANSNIPNHHPSPIRGYPSEIRASPRHEASAIRGCRLVVAAVFAHPTASSSPAISGADPTTANSNLAPSWPQRRRQAVSNAKQSERPGAGLFPMPPPPTAHLLSRPARAARSEVYSVLNARYGIAAIRRRHAPRWRPGGELRAA